MHGEGQGEVVRVGFGVRHRVGGAEDCAVKIVLAVGWKKLATVVQQLNQGQLLLEIVITEVLLHPFRLPLRRPCPR